MSGKIIIRPLRSREPPAPSPPPASDSEPAEPEEEDQPEEEQEDEENNEDNENENNEEIEEVVATEDGAPSDPDGVTAEAPVVKIPRPRGRPKGSGKPKPPQTGTPRPRGRPKGSGKRGRPRREGETIEGDEAGEEGSEGGGPIGGGKPFRRINGKVCVIEGDEFVTEEDPKGNTKIDAAGRLLGDRRFKAQTFNLPQRHPEKMFMLAIDAARTSGFRDSLYYFRRNPLAFKLNATQPEKDYLIEIGKLGPHLRTRSVTLITARSAYKLHGAKMLIDGRWVVDDYYEDKVLEEITTMGLQPGDLVGDLQDPSTQTELAQLTGGDKQSRVERGGGGGIYRAGGPTTLFGGSGWGPYSDGPLNAVRKSMLTRDGLTEENWMSIAAQRTIEAGEEFGRLRREALRVYGGILGDPSSTPGSPKRSAEDENEETREERRRREEAELALGVYEPHNGIVVYRSDTQPARSRWEQGARNEERRILGGTKTGNGAWGLAWVDTVMEFTPAEPPGPVPVSNTQVETSGPGTGNETGP